MESIATNRKARNRMLAARLRSEGIKPTGDAWQEAKVIRDTLHEEAGYSPAEACRIAAAHVRLWGTALNPKDTPDVRPEDEPKAKPSTGETVEALETVVKAARKPVTQVQEPKAPAKRTPVQAQRVAAGEVMRDSKGRILPRSVQEAWQELASLAHDDKGISGDYESFAGGRVTA